MLYVGLFLSLAGLAVTWLSGSRQTKELACVRSENETLLKVSTLTLFVVGFLCVAIIASRKAG